MVRGQGEETCMTTSRRDLTLTEQELLYRLRWSVRFRWFAGCATIVALWVAWFKFGVRFPVASIVIVAMSVPFYNAVFVLFLSNLTGGESMSIRKMTTLANAQVVCDILAVVALIQLTGGVENPFVIFLAVPIVYSLPLLTRRVVFWHTTLAVVLLNVVFWGQCFGILDHICLPTVGEELLHANRLFVFQVSFATTVTLYLLLFIGGSVAGTLRQRERELESAHRQLKELHQARTFYVRKVSHELRAPLAAIRSLLRVILQGLAGALGEKQRSMMERIDARAEGLLELVAELLTFSRLEALEAPQDDEIINMSELVGKIARLFQPMAQEKNLQMTVSVVPFSVKGNREDLRELVTNLIRLKLITLPINHPAITAKIFLIIGFIVTVFVV